MTTKRTTIPIKGINRSLPRGSGQDGFCHEIINMRYRDGAWRGVSTKSKSANPVMQLVGLSIIKAMPQMDNKYLIGYATEGQTSMGARGSNFDTFNLTFVDKQTAGLVRPVRVMADPTGVAVGDLYGGGIVASLLNDELLIVSLEYATEFGGVLWDHAVVAASEYNAGGNSDWRLPTASELTTMRMVIYLSHNTSPPLTELLEDGFHWTNQEDQQPNYQLRLIDTTLDTSTLIKQYNEDETVSDLFFFGRIMIANVTGRGRDLFKLNDDNISFTELLPLPEGQHVFWQDETAPQDVALVEESNSFEDNVADVARRRYEDRRDGRFEGHCFFRTGWRMFDGSIIMHGPVHYHHVGLCLNDLYIDGSQNPAWILKNYTANKPLVRASFTPSEREIIEAYKGIVRGLVIFMSDPVSTYSGEWYQDAQYSYIYKPKDNDSLDDLLEQVRGFYRVSEISLEDILAMQFDASGLLSLTRVIDVGDVNSIETHELMPVDNFTNHVYQGQDVYDYNSRLHLGDIITHFKDTYNPGRYRLDNGYGVEHEQGLVYGETELLTFPFPTNFTPTDDVSGDVGEQTSQSPSYAVKITANLSDPDSMYTLSTGALTTDAYALIRIRIALTYFNFNSILPHPQWQETYVIFEIFNTVTEQRLWFHSILDAEYNYDPEGGPPAPKAVSYWVTIALQQDDSIILRAYVAADPQGEDIVSGIDICPLIVGKVLYENMVAGQAAFDFTPVIVVELETGQGQRKTVKQIEQIAAYEQGITMYKALEEEKYWLFFKEFLTYPDKRAKKIRLLSKESGDVYKILFEQDLIAHPHFNFAYSKPLMVRQGNYHYLRNMVYMGTNGTLGLFSSTSEPVANPTLRDSNRVQVSELNNVWLYPARLSYRIGTASNEVVAISTMSEPLSTGQFGQFPLTIFTLQGIFNLNQGDGGDVIYLNVTRMNLDVLANKKAMLELGGAIVYATAYGLYILDGSKRTEISHNIEGSVTGIRSRADKWKLPDNAFATDVSHIDVFSDIEFILYLAGAVMVYDDNNKEIIISNPSKPYTYVYQIEFNLWHKIRLQLSRFVNLANGVNVAIDPDNYIHQVETESFAAIPVSMLTRPMLLEDSNLKKIERLVARVITDASVGHTTMHLFASIDGRTWTWVSGLTITNSGYTPVISDLMLKRTHTSARYFMLSLATVADSAFELTDIDIDVKYKHQMKLR